MIIVKKSLNNSMLLVDNNHQEMILFGKGIGFGTKPGTPIDMAQVEQVFIPLENPKSRHFLSLVDTIPAAFFDVTHDIIALAQPQYTRKLNAILLFTLAEHLYFAVEEARSGNRFANKLSWEIQRYYPTEYAISLQARDLIGERFAIHLPDDEAVNIAFHFINAQSSEESASAHQQVELVNRIAEIVRYRLNRDLDTHSVNYMRFITHLRYFAERVLTGKTVADNNEDFYQEFLKHRPDAMKVSWAIRDYIQEKYAISLPNDELTYLTIHISRLATSP
ncbi:PRD domain-containing protein [Musicola keenii]|uniref:PRD domain-containing protein n=1 Tax=Musicola keenii TaxID=2884250 RepID=UPI0017818D15